MSPGAIIETIPVPANRAGVTLVLGGARSGKSRFAETLLADHPGPRIYLATAEAGDGEMAERIRRHRERRGDAWLTVEEPLDLAGALRHHDRRDNAILVDCLTLWLSNVMAAGRDPGEATAELVATFPRLAAGVVLVSNEVGQGIVPDNELARAFRDHAGWLNQAGAAAVDRVFLVTAGLPMLLKSDTAARARTPRPNSPPQRAQGKVSSS